MPTRRRFLATAAQLVPAGLLAGCAAGPVFADLFFRPAGAAIGLLPSFASIGGAELPAPPHLIGVLPAYAAN